MKKIKIFSIVFLLFISFGADQVQIEKWKTALKTAEGEARLEILVNLSQALSKENYDQAIDYADEGLKYAKKIKNEKYNSLFYRNKATSYFYKNNLKKSLRYYEKEYSLLEETDDIASKMRASYNLATIYKQSERSSKALQYYTESKKYANVLNDNELIALIYKSTAEVYESTKDYKKAYAAYRGYTSIVYNELEKETSILQEDYKSIQLLKKKTDKIIGFQKNKLENAKKKEENLLEVGKQKELEIDELTEDVEIKEDEITKKEEEITQKEEEISQKTKILQQQNMLIVLLVIIFVLVLVASIIFYRLYKQNRKAFLRIEKLNVEILNHKNHIDASIRYASKIQSVLLPPEEMFLKTFKEYFIYYKPRDVVSGDFYWLKNHNENIIITAADCTGHGIPGAFMSMLGIASLNDIINNAGSKELKANEILNELRNKVKRALRQTGKIKEAKDGMDMALCVINKKEMKLQYSGAHNPLVYVRKGKLVQIKADRMPVGIQRKDKNSFTNHELVIEKGDVFYLFSDGFQDQFGGSDGNKYMSKKFKELLLENHKKPLDKQKEILHQVFTEWKGTEYKQIDDVLVLSFII